MIIMVFDCSCQNSCLLHRLSKFLHDLVYQKTKLSEYLVPGPLVTTKLKYQDVMDMLNGMRQGNMKYNYLRMPAEAGQNTFTEAQLLTLKTQLEPKGELISMYFFPIHAKLFLMPSLIMILTYLRRNLRSYPAIHDLW